MVKWSDQASQWHETWDMRDGSEASSTLLPTCLRTWECHSHDPAAKVGDAWAEKTQGASGDGLSRGERPHQDPERPAHTQQIQHQGTSYYKSSSVCLFVCLSVCLFVPYLLRGPLTDLRQTWWVYVGGPRNCPWGVLFRKGQRLDGSTGHFHFPLYYICTSLMPHAATAPLACSCRV